MRFLVVARREFRAAFESPIGYVFLSIFSAMAAVFLFLFFPFFEQDQATVRPLFEAFAWLFVVLCPAATMRMWSEERRSGTEELLLTLPFRLRDLVLGKFLGAWGLVAVALLFTLGIPITVSWLADGATIDWGVVVGGYLGALLLAASYLAIGLFISALTRNQIIAFIVTSVLLFAFFQFGRIAELQGMPEWLVRFVDTVALRNRFLSIARGVVDLRDLLYYTAFTAVFLSLNGLALEKRRWG